MMAVEHREVVLVLHLALNHRSAHVARAALAAAAAPALAAIPSAGMAASETAAANRGQPEDELDALLAATDMVGAEEEAPPEPTWEESHAQLYPAIAPAPAPSTDGLTR